MPRSGRIAAGGIIYHVLNRGNGRARLFHKPEDYDAFLQILIEVKEAVAVQVLGLCLMPNHWHLALLPADDGDLSRFMLRLTTTHVRRRFAQTHDRDGGHLYQGRFKNFPVQSDNHLLTLLRYIEANPLRAKLVDRARNWRWSSLGIRKTGNPAGLLDRLPLDLPQDWERLVQARWEEEQLKTLRGCVVRGRPFGDDDWVDRMSRKLGLEFTLRPRGRPPKQTGAAEDDRNQE
jgi:putative transposase